MTSYSFEAVTAIATAIGSAVALIALILGYPEYKKQSRTRRAEFYVKMQEAFLTNAGFQRIRTLLFSGDASSEKKLKRIPKIQRNDYAGFFEDLAILASNDLVSIQVIGYMFGQDLLKCHQSTEFWHDFIRDEASWKVLNDFVIKISKVRADLPIEKIR